MKKKEEFPASGIQKVFEQYTDQDENVSFVESITASLQKFKKKEDKDEQKKKKEEEAKEDNTTKAGNNENWKDDPKKKKLPFLLDILLTITILSVLLFVFRSYIFSPFNIEGESMEGNLHHGEFIYVDRLLSKFIGYERGNVIVFLPPTSTPTEEKGLICWYDIVKNTVLFEGKENPCIVEATYVKRIIGLPGDSIEVKDGQVYVTPLGGEKTKITDHFLKDENKGHTCLPAGKCSASKNKIGMKYGPVPEGKLFVLGDNRTHSSDSRSTRWDSPFVDQERVIGVARAVFLSPQTPRFNIEQTTLEIVVDRIKNIPASFGGIRRITTEKIID